MKLRKNHSNIYTVLITFFSSFQGDIQSFIFDTDPSLAAQMCRSKLKLAPSCDRYYRAAVVEPPVVTFVSQLAGTKVGVLLLSVPPGVRLSDKDSNILYA